MLYLQAPCHQTPRWLEKIYINREQNFLIFTDFFTLKIVRICFSIGKSFLSPNLQKDSKMDRLVSIPYNFVDVLTEFRLNLTDLKKNYFCWWINMLEDNYLDVVAPPIRSGSFIPILSISLATNIISSSDGVINPDRPTISKKIKFNLLIQSW